MCIIKIANAREKKLFSRMGIRSGSREVIIKKVFLSDRALNFSLHPLGDPYPFNFHLEIELLTASKNINIQQLIFISIKV